MFCFVLIAQELMPRVLKQYVTGSFLARTWARGANASEIELIDAETVRGQSRF
jgi:hypothetical protein